MPIYSNITLTLETDLSFQAGQFVQVIHDTNNYIFGQVVSYDPLTGIMVFSPTSFAGSGTFCSWVVVPSGASGSSGTSGGGGGTSSKVCAITSGGDIIDTNDKIGFNSVFYNYSVYDCSNYVAGTLIAVWNPQSNAVEFSNTTTSSIGNTDAVTFAFQSVGNSINLVMYAPDNTWKYSFRKITLDDCCTVPYISGAFILTQSGSELITESGDFLITS